jgi:hypothetical protein
MTHVVLANDGFKSGPMSIGGAMSYAVALRCLGNYRVRIEEVKNAPNPSRR